MVSENESLALPTERDQEQAKLVQRHLAHLQQSDRCQLRLQAASGEETVELPHAVVALLNRILTEMADGNAVTLVPVHAELTTSQAADLLNVSRPHFVKLLESGAIAFTKVGSHRRIKAEDVLRYREERMKKRSEALDELTAEAQRLGLGY
jgi:excisionase family DNA binding protein